MSDLPYTEFPGGNDRYFPELRVTTRVESGKTAAYERAKRKPLNLSASSRGTSLLMIST